MKFLCCLFLLFLSSCHHNRSSEDPLVAIQIYDRNGLTETISNPDRLEAFEETDFFASQPYEKVLRVYRKEGKNHSKITTYHPNGALSQYLEAEEMRAHGAYREWYPNGQLKIEATVIGGTADVAAGSQHDWLFDGISRAWDERGHLLAEMPYQGGVLEGKSFHYHETGQLKKELPYINHHLDGEGIEYYPTGALRAKIHFQKDLQHGESLGFFETGERAWVEKWEEGRLLEATYFNPEGEKIAEINEGRGCRIVFRQKTILRSVEIQDGVPEGVVKNFSSDGKIESSYEIKNGKKQGDEILYFPKTGRPKMKLHWDADSIHGLVQTWYESGQLQSEREYGRNKKMGRSLGWYKNGSVMLVEEYENDTLVKGRYYKKGSKEPISSIQNGTGTAYLFDEEGVLLRKVPYLKGKAQDPDG